MAKRIVTKIGDIFLVKLDNCQKYFQYIADDMTILNSSVIRVFKKGYPLNSSLDMNEIASGEVDFYVHTVLKWGIQLGLWEKIGKNPQTGSTDHILFRSTKDVGVGVPPGEKPPKISSRWYVWKINEEIRYVGTLKGENRNAEIGLVEPAVGIVHRMKTGEFYGSFPGFE